MSGGEMWVAWAFPITVITALTKLPSRQTVRSSRTSSPPAGLMASIIKAGVIQSHDGSSWWDLESGEVVLRAYATSKEVTEVHH